MRQEEKQNKHVTFIDLFAGLGGIRLGFEQALADRGMEGDCIFTSEIKPSAIKALNYNFPGENISATDITKKDSKEIGHFSILLGGFPCQAFSAAGNQKGFADTRGTLFFDVERILKDHLKEVDGFILENVEGLVTHDRENPSDKEGRTIRIIMSILKDELHYNAEYVVLNAADFGVPQCRKRVYIIGCKKKFGKVNLKFNAQPHVGVGGLLEHGLPCLNNGFSQRLLSIYPAKELNGKALKDKRGGLRNIHSWDIAQKGEVTEQEKDLLNTLLLERRKRKWAEEIGIDWMDGMPLTFKQIKTFYPIKGLKKMLDELTQKKYLYLEHPKKRIEHEDENGNKWYSRIPDETKPKGYNIVTGKLSFEISSFMDIDSPSNTLVAMDMNTLGVVDGDGIRHLTLREGLRLFGYPESYSLELFEGSSKDIELGYDLIGNSVCVPVIRAVATRLLDRIYKEKDI